MKLTWNAEGSDDNATLAWHWPGGNSGPTLGKGLDFSSGHTKNYLQGLLSEAGVEWTASFDAAIGLKGDAASAFCHANPGKIITPVQQKAIFRITYDFMASDVARICDKKDTIKKYGVVPEEHRWGGPVWELVVDLRFRGDYTPKTRVFVQPCLVDNSIFGLSLVLRNYYGELWSSVPRERQRLREAFVLNAIKRGM